MTCKQWWLCLRGEGDSFSSFNDFCQKVFNFVIVAWFTATLSPLFSYVANNSALYNSILFLVKVTIHLSKIIIHILCNMTHIVISCTSSKLINAQPYIEASLSYCLHRLWRMLEQSHTIYIQCVSQLYEEVVAHSEWGTRHANMS
jgi:hypothetical protein